MKLFMLHHEKEEIHVLDPDFQALAATEGIIAACSQLPALKPSTAQYPHFRIDRDASTSSAQRLVCQRTVNICHLFKLIHGMVSSVADLEAYACLADSATGIVISNRKVRMTAEGNNFLDKL